MLCCLPVAIAGYALIRTSKDDNVSKGGKRQSLNALENLL